MKKLFFSVMLSVIVVLCGCNSKANVNSNLNNSSNQVSESPRMDLALKSAYEYANCQYPWSSHGNDWSYIVIDSNPYNLEDNTRYLNSAVAAIEKVNQKLGLPSSLYNSILKTSALMGRQVKTFSSLGIEVSWSYHPDNGIEIMYSIIVD